MPIGPKDGLLAVKFAIGMQDVEAGVASQGPAEVIEKLTAKVSPWRQKQVALELVGVICEWACSAPTLSIALAYETIPAQRYIPQQGLRILHIYVSSLATCSLCAPCLSALDLQGKLRDSIHGSSTKTACVELVDGVGEDGKQHCAVGQAGPAKDLCRLAGHVGLRRQ